MDLRVYNNGLASAAIRQVNVTQRRASMQGSHAFVCRRPSYDLLTHC
jgi:hypothetical protein